MTRAVCATQPFGQPRHPDGRRKIGRVDFVDRRNEHEIDIGRLQHCEIGRLAARV
jgi:hypothetical protein